MADGRATAFMGLRTVRQESHETVINFVLRIGLLASRAYSNNREMADCITLLVLKRGINEQLRPAVARAANVKHYHEYFDKLLKETTFTGQLWLMLQILTTYFKQNYKCSGFRDVHF